MESILAKIKGEKKLSFNSFRYRILHWSFFLHWPFRKAPKSPSESPLPQFLYTHYCPLFHLTNLLVFPGIFITLPMHLVAFFGVAIAYLFCGMLKLIAATLDAIQTKMVEYREWREKRFPSAKRDAKKKAKQEKKRARILAMEKAKEEAAANNTPLPVTPQLMASFKRYMLNHALKSNCFDSFLQDAQYCCNEKYDPIFFNKEYSDVRAEWQAAWDEYKARIKEQRALAQKKKDMLRDRIIWWSNFSRIFIKGLLNLLYVGVAAATIYFGVTWVIPTMFEVCVGVCHFIAAAFAASSEVDFMGILKWLLGWTVFVLGWATAFVATVFAIVYLLKSVKWPVKKAKRMITGIFGPFVVAGSTFCSWFGRTFVWTTEFIMMFYEQNCPPITIVDESEERIAAEGEI